MQTVLGIDVGTQSSKVMFYDYQARKVAALASAPHQLTSKADGTSEQDPLWWFQAIQAALDSVDPEIRQSAVAAAVSGQQHGLVALDEGGQAVYPAKLWNDTSTVDQCNELTRAFGGSRRLIDELGNPILPGYTAGKILWLKQNHPRAFDRVRHILLPHDYINYLLTGEYRMEYGDASGTGLFDVRRRCWNREICGLVDDRLSDMLPEPRGPEAGAGWVSKEASQEFGIPEGIPVAAGGGDNMMAAIGTGAVSDGSLTMSLGTSGTLFGFSSSPVVDPEGTIAAFCSSNGGWLPLLCTMNCTVATEQFRELLSVGLSELDSMVEQVPPASDGLIVMPYFTGERIPNLPRARGSIQGMTLANSDGPHIIRASMEAAIYGLKIGLDSLAKLGMKADSITVTGGGSRSRAWRQIAADILELPVTLPVHSDSAAMGAALQALWYRDLLNNGKNISMEDVIAPHVKSRETRRIEPGEDRKKYREGYAEYLAYLELLKPRYQ
ncbi:xylulokinase [Salinispira pacifica]|uniref:Xylulose kinase n=1 Tax=Salinispira pacifica TaxID=1307761 RepID=V5WJC2_9SPIO|nr:xylulokinase [Salinispira pacifica]AHC15878.1 Xylulose kinase [Salinispira pacifica]